MKSWSKTLKTLLMIFIFCSISYIFPQNASASFIVSAESNSYSSNLYGDKVYEYKFSTSSITSDYTVNVSDSTLTPDISMKLVDNPQYADLIFVDNFDKADMKVCKTSIGFDTLTINVSNSAILSDISILLSRSPLFFDYTIFVASTKFTKEEAAALFAVIWEENRNK